MTSKEPSIGRGRPRLDPVDRVRAKVWYLAVKARGGWTDYRLDVEFARCADEPRREGSERRRAFEAVRRTGTVPSPGTHPRRDFDLVENVESHPDFVGTANIFHSPFWNLLKMRVMGIPEASAFTSQCMTHFKLHRPSGKLYDVIRYSWLRADLPYGENKDIYLGAIKTIVSRLPQELDALALLGGLFREAYLVCSLETAGILKNQFIEFLEQYGEQKWLGATGNELVLLAERRVLYWQIDKHYDDNKYYDDWPPNAVERPLFFLNESMQQLIDKEDESFAQLMTDYAEAARSRARFTE